MTDTPSRHWRAACPHCGAPVEFRSAASVSAVCGYCRSTLLRDGDTLTRIGQSAELFDDHSPLRLGTSGRLQGAVFTLVGRLQLEADGAPWTAWHALFDNGRSGWLSEDNGRHVFSFDGPAPAEAPAADALGRLGIGARLHLGGQAWTLGSRVQARLRAAEGELPTPPQADARLLVADLRNDRDEVATLEYTLAAAAPGDAPARPEARPTPRWSLGRGIALADLQLSGLRDLGAGAGPTIAARSLPCPSCANALAVTLASTQSIVCGQCKAVVDLSGGIGGELAHYAQSAGPEPRIPLGSTGRLAVPAPGQTGAPPGLATAWQALGYARHVETEPDAGSTGRWDEYLLWHPAEGFAFLVDTAEGWSFVRTLTGTPTSTLTGVRLAGRDYVRRCAYDARISHVRGEFYWPLRRGALTHHVDFAGRGGDAAGRVLSLERTDHEQTWSEGVRLDTTAVAQAFGLDPAALQPGGPRPAPAPGAGSAGSSQRAGKLLLLLMLLFAVMILVTWCSHDDCGDERRAFGRDSLEYRQCVARSGSGVQGNVGTGGAWGGYSSGGGGHK